jgi:hypothetical protein
MNERCLSRAQRAGREKWYRQFDIKVAKVEREYGFLR